MAAFIVWLCVQMAIDPFKATFLITIAAGIAVGVLALALGTVHVPSRHRRAAAAAAEERRAGTPPEPSRPRRPGGMSPRPG